MTDRVKELSQIAIDYAAEQYGPQRAGEKVWDPLTYDRKFAELIVGECMAICDTEKVDYINNKKAAWDWEEKNIYAEGAAAADSIKFKMKHSFGIK